MMTDDVLNKNSEQQLPDVPPAAESADTPAEEAVTQ